MSERELPKIDIAGIHFFLDIRLNELRQVDNFMNRIDLDSLWAKENGGYLVCFDPITKNIFYGTEVDYHARKDLVEVHLPSIEAMDPVGFAQMIEQWKKDNPLLSSMIQSLPVVVPDKPDLLPKKHQHHNKGKHL